MDSLPDREDIVNLLVAIEEICQFHSDESKSLAVNYAVFKALHKDDRIHSMIKRKFLAPDMFLRLPKDESGESVAVTTLMSAMTRVLSQEGLFASLACFSIGDVKSELITSIDALEDWLFRLSFRLTQIQKMTEQFLPLWVFTAAHTFAFFHGKQQSSKVHAPIPGSSRTSSASTCIKIRDLVASETMNSLLQLSKPFLDEMEANPFSRLRAVRYYDSFTVFDTSRLQMSGDQTMYPLTDICPIFSGGYMSPVFMERMLHTYGGFDYRRFLTFAIAWDNRRTAAGVKYFWPIIDITGKGYITMPDLTDLVTGIMKVLLCLPGACGPQGAEANSVLMDEIFDLFHSHRTQASDTNPDAIFTLSDALEKPTALGTVVGILGNTQAFIEYECREDTAHKLFVAKQVKDARSLRMKQSQLSRNGQLSALQTMIDDCWFARAHDSCNFDSFSAFLDYHETKYGGESMEPWLNKYYQWEQQEAENHQMILMESQYVLSEGDSQSLLNASAEGVPMRE